MSAFIRAEKPGPGTAGVLWANLLLLSRGPSTPALGRRDRPFLW